MTAIAQGESKVALGMGTVFGTARDLSVSGKGGLLHCSKFQDDGSFDQYESNNIGQDLQPSSIANLGQKVTVTGQSDCTFSGNIWQIVAAFLGLTTTTPAEQTAGQGDYAHTMDMQSKNSTAFMTLSRLTESAVAREINSAQVETLDIEIPLNDIMTIAFTAKGDQLVIPASVNNPTIVNGLSYPVEDAMIYGNTNDYFRMNAQTGGALSSSDNLPIDKISLKLTRTLDTRYTLRGSLSRYSNLFLQTKRIAASIEVEFSQLDSSEYAGFADWIASTEKKAEIYLAGDLIGTTLPRSVKIQLPRLKPLAKMPTGTDVTGNSGTFKPIYSFDLLKPVSAPTGMTGVTNMIRNVMTSTRVTSFFN